MIKEYDKRDLMKNFPASKLTIAPLRTTIKINEEVFFVPTKEYYLKNEKVMEYYNYVIEAIKNETIFDNFFKILALQSWPVSYIPGKKPNEMYMTLRNFILGSMEEYNIIYLKLVRKKKLQDGTITINRTHIVGRIGTENYYDYSTSPFYTFYIDGNEYLVPSTNVQEILDKIDKIPSKTEIIHLLEKQQNNYSRPRRHRKHQSIYNHRSNK